MLSKILEGQKKEYYGKFENGLLYTLTNFSRCRERQHENQTRDSVSDSVPIAFYFRFRARSLQLLFSIRII